ncbi:MAG: hypothetical protein K7J46_16590 [Bryobacter sp.]|nr:hypothetical protein [Bryobacter sp. CoA8 C33]
MNLIESGSLESGLAVFHSLDVKLRIAETQFKVAIREGVKLLAGVDHGVRTLDEEATDGSGRENEDAPSEERFGGKGLALAANPLGNGAQGNAFTIGGLNILEVEVDLAAAAKTLLLFGPGNGADSHSAPLNENLVVDLDIFGDGEADALASLSGGTSDQGIGAKADLAAFRQNLGEKRKAVDA